MKPIGGWLVAGALGFVIGLVAGRWSAAPRPADDERPSAANPPGGNDERAQGEVVRLLQDVLSNQRELLARTTHPSDVSANPPSREGDAKSDLRALDAKLDELSRSLAIHNARVDAIPKEVRVSKNQRAVDDLAARWDRDQKSAWDSVFGWSARAVYEEFGAPDKTYPLPDGHFVWTYRDVSGSEVHAMNIVFWDAVVTELHGAH